MHVAFGTDGVRGKAGTPPLDPETLKRIGAALGAWARTSGADHPVVLGNDGRASAPWIRDALVQGLSSAGVASIDLGLVTTPALAFVTRHEQTAAGIMISASHNPACDNGVKIFGGDGRKLSDDAEREIEGRVAETELPADCEPDVAERGDLVDRYHTFVSGCFGKLNLAGQKIVCDAANGGGSRIAPHALESLGAEVVRVACAPDGENINDGVGALHPETLVATVVQEGARLGVCLDGDGDRCIVVDDAGSVRDGDEIMYVLAKQLAAAGALPAQTLVATVMSNLGLFRALEGHGVSVHTTPVGDRSVAQAMQEHGFGLGGEQSGHVIFGRDEHQTGDGLFTALQLLALAGTGPTAALFDGFRRYPQTLLNVRVDRKPDLTTLDDVQAAVRDVEADLGRDGRVVLRYSGTENLCRVMVEGPDADTVHAHAETIARAVQRALS